MMRIRGGRREGEAQKCHEEQTAEHKQLGSGDFPGFSEEGGAIRVGNKPNVRLRKREGRSVVIALFKILVGGCLFGLIAGAMLVYHFSPSTVARATRAGARLRSRLENKTGVHISIHMAKNELASSMNTRLRQMAILAKSSSSVVYEQIHRMWRSNLEKLPDAANPRAVPPAHKNDLSNSVASDGKQHVGVNEKPSLNPESLSKTYETMRSELKLKRALRRHEEAGHSETSLHTDRASANGEGNYILDASKSALGNGGPKDIVVANVKDKCLPTDYLAAKSEDYHSQDEQDKLVSQLLRGKAFGFFVEFGAGDGVFHSNSLFFEKHLCWTGLCVEPSKYIFEKLVENRPRCTRVWGAICNSDQTQRKYTDVLSPTGWTGWSGFFDTFSLQHKAQIAEKERTQGWRTETYLVKCHTLESLLRDYAPHGMATGVDYLSIDTEGSEKEIIDSIDFGRLKMSGVVQVEANLNEILQLRDANAIQNVQKIRDRMRNFDFHGPLTARSGLDEFFVPKDTWKTLSPTMQQKFTYQIAKLPSKAELLAERNQQIQLMRQAAASGALDEQRIMLQQKQRAYIEQWMRMTPQQRTLQQQQWQLWQQQQQQRYEDPWQQQQQQQRQIWQQQNQQQSPQQWQQQQWQQQQWQQQRQQQQQQLPQQWQQQQWQQQQWQQQQWQQQQQEQQQQQQQQWQFQQRQGLPYQPPTVEKPDYRSSLSGREQRMRVKQMAQAAYRAN